MRELRQIAGKAQEDVASALNIKQPSVSKIENQADMYLSTLRSYVEAIGGKLELTVKLPARPPVRIEHLGDLTQPAAKPAARRAGSGGGLLDAETITRLLASMNAAAFGGLRRRAVDGAPSSLPSARTVAERCFDKYRLESDPNCDLALRENLEALAEHFAGLHTLQSVFIEHLVPWPAFVRPSNTGHAAIADFLIIRAAVAGISSNYDTLIERRAWDYGADFRGSLDGDEATANSVRQAPLLKFHGCSHRDRQATVWAPSQLEIRPSRGALR